MVTFFFSDNIQNCERQRVSNFFIWKGSGASASITILVLLDLFPAFKSCEGKSQR